MRYLIGYPMGYLQLLQKKIKLLHGTKTSTHGTTNKLVITTVDKRKMLGDWGSAFMNTTLSLKLLNWFVLGPAYCIKYEY